MLKRAGRYEIVAELGRGGFGQVYRAIDPTLDSMVAIKTLSVESDASILARFRNEAAASRRLHHPNIVTIYDFGEQDGIPFIVMELLEGQDLAHVIESRKPIPLWHKIQIMSQVASGLGHAHACGIVHRDVKPANIMLLPDGNIKIMDFGIALVSQDTQNRLTPRGAVIGTFRYMAPEQFRGPQQDARGDIFAYGLVFYELLTGIHPFHAREPAAVMFNILNLEPVPIRDILPDCPDALDAVITRLLQKDPEFRYQTLEDLLFDCEPLLHELKHERARDLFKEAQTARESGRLETAQALLRQVVELDPSYSGARELREHLQAELRRATVRPRIEALSAEAREQLAAGNPAEALAKFEAAVRLDPSDYTLKSWMEQAKAAVEQSRHVTRLIADAERALKNGDLTGAHRIARQAAELAPSEKRAREIVAQAEAALAEQEKQVRFAENLSKAARLIEIRSWEPAAAVLDQLAQEFPLRREIRGLSEMLNAGKLADERQQKLSAGLQAARQEIQARNLERASSCLAALHLEFPASSDVEQLLAYVTAEIGSQKKRDLVDRSLTEARSLVAQDKFAAAVDVLERALTSYPSDTQLERELRSVVTARQQAERDAALSEALSSSNALRAQGELEKAFGPLEAFTSKHGTEPAIEELHRLITRERESARRAAELREMVLRINHLLSQDKAEEATVLLEASPTPLKGEPELTKLRELARAQLDHQNRRRAAFEQALNDAEAYRQKGELERALKALAAFGDQFGADPKVAEIESAIRKDKEDAERRAEDFRRLLHRADQFLTAGKAWEATQVLQAAPFSYKDHPDLTRILQAADVQLRKQAERDAALKSALSSASAAREQGRFEEGLAALEAFSAQYGTEASAAVLEQAIQNDLEIARRTAELGGLMDRVNRLLEQEQFEEAVRLLEAATAFKAEPEVVKLLGHARAQWKRQKQRRAALDQALQDAKRNRANGEFDKALQTLAAFTNTFGADTQIAELEIALRQERKEREDARRRAEEFQRLLKEADRLMAEGNAGGATQLLHSIPAGYDNHPEVTRLLDAADALTRRQAEREEARKTAIIAAMSAQREGRWDEALDGLEIFTSKYGPDGSVAALERTIRAERESAQRAEEIRELETRAQSLIAQSDYAVVVELLQQSSLRNESSILPALLREAQAAIAQEKWRITVETAVATAEARLAEADFGTALQSIDRALASYPSDATLRSTRARILAAQSEKQREDYRQQAIAEVNSLLAKYDFSRAFRVQEQAAAQLPGDSRILSLRAEIEERQRTCKVEQAEQELQNTLRRARELIVSKPDDAVALLERLSAQHGNRSELAAFLTEAREAVYQATEGELIRDAGKLADKGKFGEAISKLKQATRRTTQLDAAQEQIEARWNARVAAQVAEGIESSRKKAVRKPSTALRDIEKLAQQFPGRPEIATAIEDLQQELRAKEVAAKEAADRKRVEQERRRREAAAASAVTVETAPASTAPLTARRWMRPALGIAAAAAAGAGVWWITHWKKPVPPPAQVAVQVRSDPQGASVRIGNLSCVTPRCTIDLLPGNYNVSARLDGYEPIEQTLTVTPGHASPLDLTLRPIASAPPPGNTAGTLTVRTRVPDALVFVDDVPRGRTDATGALSLQLEPATHTLRVEKVGYDTARDQRVKIDERVSMTVSLKLSPQMALLELHGAPAGIELRIGEQVIGRTDGTPFSTRIEAGDHVLHLAEGSAIRDISLRFEPGRTVDLYWANVGPAKPLPPAVPPAPQIASAPKPDPSDEAWRTASSSADLTAIQDYLLRYPNSRHTSEAQGLLDSRNWSRVNQNDAQSLRDYLNRFPNGSHARDASRELEELAWNGVDKKDPEALGRFMQQNPDSPHKPEASGLIDQLTKQAQERERAKQEQKETDAQMSQVQAALERFNSAFAQKKQNDLKAVWPSPDKAYLEAVKAPRSTLRLEDPSIKILGDTATVECTQESQADNGSSSQRVTVTLKKSDGGWLIIGLHRR